MSERGNDWLQAIQQKQIKKSLCMECTTELEQMCVNNRKGGRTILPLSAEPRQVVEVNEPIEECQKYREVIIYKREEV